MTETYSDANMRAWQPGRPTDGRIGIDYSVHAPLSPGWAKYQQVGHLLDDIIHYATRFRTLYVKQNGGLHMTMAEINEFEALSKMFNVWIVSPEESDPSDVLDKLGPMFEDARKVAANLDEVWKRFSEVIEAVAEVLKDKQ